jgi:hypothetical protein
MEIPRESGHLGYVGVDGRITLKYIFEKYDVKM